MKLSEFEPFSVIYYLCVVNFSVLPFTSEGMVIISIHRNVTIKGANAVES